MNAFSASDVDVDLENILEVCQNYSNLSPDKQANKAWRELVSNI